MHQLPASCAMTGATGSGWEAASALHASWMVVVWIQYGLWSPLPAAIRWNRLFMLQFLVQARLYARTARPKQEKKRVGPLV